MGKVVKFVGRLFGAVTGFATGGIENALASIPLTIAAFSQNPLLIAAAIGSDLLRTFSSHGGPTTPAGPPTVFRQSISDSFIIYGRRRVAGLQVFFHAKKSGSSHYRYFVIACAGHHVQGNPAWMLGDETVTVDGSGKVTSGAYANAAWLWLQLGADSETANATFVSECDGKWTTAHKGNGVAAIYAKFKMTDDVIQAGMPNISVVIDGKDDIADPRDSSTGYTNNAALCFYDWMALPREEGGFGAYADEIPDDTWISAQANVCDETIEGEARYAIDAVITTGAPPGEVRDIFVVNCAGMYTFSEGKHLMRVGYWVPPSETLEEGDLAGAIRVSPFLTGDQAANEIQISYVNPDDGYQGAAAATQTTDPAPDDIRQASLDLAFITSKYRAERIGQIALRRAAAEKTVAWPMNIMGLKTGALDTVALGTDRYGLSNYAFVVSTWGLAHDPANGPGVALTLREENEDIYEDPTPVTADTVPSIALAEPVTLTRDIATLIKASEAIDADPADGLLQATDTTITIEGHGRRYSDKEISVDGGTVAVVAAEGLLNHVYYDDPDREGGAVTYQVDIDSIVASNSPDNPGRHYVGSVQTAATGETNTAGGQVPSGWDPNTFYNEDPEVIYDGGAAA